jgi:hypothetical protein
MNFKRHINTIYTVYNQNGFNAALYDYFGLCNYSKKEIREMVQNHPTTYPKSIRIVDQSFECRRVYIEEINLENLLP